jgi:N,N-dimethylformamidase beta subunit-like protein/Big-like domain-containing protein
MITLLVLIVVNIGIFPSVLFQNPRGSVANAQSSSQSGDNTIPSIRITYPTYCSDSLVKGNLTIRGTAHDEESGISRVEVYIHPLPINDDFLFEMAVPVSEGDWSTWSFDGYIPDDGKTYRILVQATNGLGMVNSAETLVNADSIRGIHEAREIADSGRDQKDSPRIALVTPTFTSAAYNYDSFYFFYYRYASVAEGVAITEDLNLMTGEIPLESEDAGIIESFASRIREFSPGSIVTTIEDENVHHGLIFGENGRNAYDTLVLFHNEYVTQEEYDNLRTFVNNGGSIVFLNANIFYAEVKYDETSCMVTLVKGHNWEFDGNAVRKGVWERFAEENREWMGSNFINRDISNPVRFDNNPFGYVHFEENELLNPNAKILVDYNAKFKLESTNNPLIIGGVLKPDEYSDLGMRVATYELQSGSGKVIMTGIFAQNLVNNTAFMDFFDKIILTRSLGEKHNVNVDNYSFEAYTKLQDGRISQMVLDKESKSLTLTLEMNKNSSAGEKTLAIILPKRLIDAGNTGTAQAGFTIFVDGKLEGYSQSYDDIERGIIMRVPSDATEVKIMGTQVAPEFQSLLILGPIVVVFLLIRLIGIHNTFHRNNRTRG